MEETTDSQKILITKTTITRMMMMRNKMEMNNTRENKIGDKKNKNKAVGQKNKNKEIHKDNKDLTTSQDKIKETITIEQEIKSEKEKGNTKEGLKEIKQN